MNVQRRNILMGTLAAAAAATTSTLGKAQTIPPAGAFAGPGKILRLDARPEPLAVDAAKTAILVIDMQNDFGAKGGMLERAGIDISMIQRAVPPTANVVAAGREAGLKIIYLKMAFKSDLSDLGADDSRNKVIHMGVGVGTSVVAPNGVASRIMVRDTWNTDILPELAPKSGDIVLYKNRFSGFYQTDLDATLKRLGTKYLIVTGCTTSICVESTIRDAMFRDYLCVLLADCTGEPIGYNLPRSNHEASLHIIEMSFGWISDSNEFLRAVASPNPRKV